MPDMQWSHNNHQLLNPFGDHIRSRPPPGEFSSRATYLQAFLDACLPIDHAFDQSGKVRAGYQVIVRTRLLFMYLFGHSDICGKEIQFFTLSTETDAEIRDMFRKLVPWVLLPRPWKVFPRHRWKGAPNNRFSKWIYTVQSGMQLCHLKVDLLYRWRCEGNPKRNLFHKWIPLYVWVVT